MKAKKYSAFWHGAVILTAAGLITKILSAFYRIPYQNIAGDIAFYTYQQVYPIYGLCLTFAVYGFPAVISKMIAEQKEDGKEERVRDILSISFWLLTLLCTIVFLFLFAASHFVARMMGDEQLYKIVRVASFCFLFMPFISMVRGYFQGSYNMLPTAVSQVTEQLLRVSTIVLLSLYFVANDFDVYTIGAGAMFGSVVGGMVSVVVLWLFLRRNLQHVLFRRWSSISKKGMIMRALFWQGITICVSNLVLIVMQFVDSLTVYNMLIGAGEFADRAKVIKGIYDRGIPLVQLGTVIATSFSLALIPVMTEARRRKDTALIRGKLRLAVKVTLVIGLGASVGLACIIKPTNIMLFENQAGSDLLAILGFSILFSALAITSATVLQGLGYTAAPALFTLVGAVTKYAANIILIPELGVKGAAVATVISLMLIVILNFFLLARVVCTSLIEWFALIRIVLSCGAMALFLMLYLFIVESVFPGASRSGASVEAIAGAVLGGLVYLIFLVKLHVFTEEELGALLHRREISFQKKMRKEKGA